MKTALLCAIGVSATCLFPGPARSQGYFGDGSRESDAASPLEYKEGARRSRNELILVSSLFGVAALGGALGSYFLVDARSKSDEVSATGPVTGRHWTADLQDTYDSANTSATVSTVGFGVAGAFILAGITAYIVTDPDDGPGYQNWQGAFVQPTRGGAVAGTALRF